ncbi:ferredoxin [Desulfonatronum thioautotrophicum]|uniref:ferredoxin n=1 Tax=Desulfonatronum thioautotrophicum TaxID=617001 RepID=UPI0005EBF0B6|nr:ferredoxin [Desulfonatronum thioautotrophicum]
MTAPKHNEDQVEVDLDLEHCSRCQGCVEMCPEVFGWDDTMDLPVLLAPTGPREEVLQVAAFCPKDCIRVAGWKRDW